MKKKYFFFDIDGTLTIPKKGEMLVPQTARYAIKKLQEAGHFVAIATGRSYLMAKDFSYHIGLGNLVCNGGNGLYIDHEKIMDQPLSRTFALSVIDECLEKQIPFFVMCENTMDRYTHIQDIQKYYDDTFYPFLSDIVYEENLDYKRFRSFDRIFVIIPKEKEASLRCLRGMHCPRYGDSPHIIIEPDDKFLGIEMLMKKMNAPLEDVVVFGDGANDIKMFQKAAFSVAMGNAVEPLKELADFVTKDSKDDGILYAVRHFHWIEEDI